MASLDYVILGAIAVSVLIGYVRGFFPELLSLVTWVVAIWAGWQYPHTALQFLDGQLDSPALELWVARFAIFGVVMIIGSLVGQLAALAIEKSRLTAVDRLLGMVFGFVRAFVVLGIVVIFAKFLELQLEPWWEESMFLPYGEVVANWLQAVLPESIDLYFDESAAKSQALLTQK